MSGNINDEERAPLTPSLWRENHGHLLLWVIAVIMLCGAVILTYQQVRFRKPRFPDKRAFDQPRGTTTASDVAVVESSLVISIMGAANADGFIMVAIYDSKADFNKPNKAVMKQSLTITDGLANCVVPLADLPPKFAVASFHDENGDGELNRSRIGIPMERYGFSRDARGVVGPPSFESAAIERPEEGTLMEIVIR